MISHLSLSDESFTLHHPDLHSGNIFVDDEFNITCLIDWGLRQAQSPSFLPRQDLGILRTPQNISSALLDVASFRKPHCRHGSGEK